MGNTNKDSVALLHQVFIENAARTVHNATSTMHYAPCPNQLVLGIAWANSFKCLYQIVIKSEEEAPEGVFLLFYEVGIKTCTTHNAPCTYHC